MKIIVTILLALWTTCALADDGAIKTCIEEHFAKSKALHGEAIAVTVAAGKVTLQGTVADTRKKGTATRIAKSKACGATSVVNELSAREKITIPRKPKDPGQ